MIVAQNSAKSRCIAFETEKAEKPFFCPFCNVEVVLKKGKIREHHFAHKPPTDCQYGTGESQIHYKIKKEIYLSLKDHPNCSKCEIERILEGVRPDVSLYIGKIPVAIEIQKNRIDIDYIIQRTVRHTKLGIYLLWVLTEPAPKTFFHEKEEEDVYRIKKWENLLHELYSDRLYYWQSGAYVIPYYLKPFSTWVEETEWYDEYGNYQQGGGFHKETKTLKTPIRYPKSPLHLAEDFTIKHRSKMRFDYHSVPQSRLWVDKANNWWK